MELQRFKHIDVIEAIAICFVVFYPSRTYEFDFVHCGTENNIVWLYYFRYLFRTILSTCVPLFFFANGYLLFSLPYDLGGHLKQTVRLSLLPLWGLVLCPIYMMMSKTTVSIRGVIENLLNLSIEWSLNLFWFIGALVCIYVFFPALKSLYDNDNKSFLLLTALLFLTTFCIRFIGIILPMLNVFSDAFVNNINQPLLNMFIPIKQYGFSFVYFCIGGIAFRYEKKLLNTNKFKRNFISACLIAVSCLTLFFVGIFNSIYVIRGLWDVVWEGYDTIPTLVNVVSIYILSLNVFKHNQLIEIVSKNTLGIYILHGLVIRATRPVLIEITLCQNSIFNMFYTIGIICVCMIMIMFLHKIPIIKRFI